MPAMKRPASASAAGAPAAKRQVVKPVAKVLRGVEGVGALLCDMLPFSLGEYHSARDARQEEIVSLVGQSLQKLKEEKEAKVASLESQAAGVDGEKATRNAALDAARSALEPLKTAVSDAAAAMETDKEALAKAKHALKEAQDAQKAGDVGVEAAKAKKAELDSTIADCLVPAKEGKATPKAIKSLVQVGKKHGLDSTLLASAPVVLKNAPEKRGDFDKVLLAQLDAGFEKAIAAVAKELEEAEPGRQAREAARKAAEDALEAVLSEHGARVAKHTEAKAALKAGEQKLAEAEQSVKSWLPDAKKVFDAVDNAKKELAEFIDGPLKTYEDLKVWEPPPEEPEAPEEPAAEEPAPAEEASAPAAEPAAPAEAEAAPAAEATAVETSAEAVA